MKQFGIFIINHWVLFLALAIILTLLIFNVVKVRLLGFKEIKPTEAVQLINQRDAIVLDVREDKEFSAGHILNAVNLPLCVLEARMAELDKYRSMPIILLCHSGQQSARAAMMMHKQGFASVYKLAGGMMAWQSANMPVTKG